MRFAFVKSTTACLLALLFALSAGSLCACEGDKNADGSGSTAETTGSSEETTSGKMPAIYCENRLYISDGYGSYGSADLLPDGFSEYGAVKSECSDSELPDEELEARGVAVGDTVYTSTDNVYAVYIVSDGELYRYLIVSSMSS